MNKLFLLLALLTAGFTTEIAAQDAPAEGTERPERRRDNGARLEAQLDELTEGLKLTPEQVTDVRAILRGTADEMKALRGQGTDRRAMREKMRPLLKAQDEKIEALLDKKQLKRYANLKEARRQERGQRGGGGGRRGGGSPNR